MLAEAGLQPDHQPLQPPEPFVDGPVLCNHCSLAVGVVFRRGGCASVGYQSAMRRKARVRRAVFDLAVVFGKPELKLMSRELPPVSVEDQ